MIENKYKMSLKIDKSTSELCESARACRNKACRLLGDSVKSLHTADGCSRLLFLPENFHKIQNCKILCPYLASAWKMHQNEYKQAYVWSSGS